MWEFTARSWIDARVTAANGLLFVGSRDGGLYALDEESGSRRWSYRTGDVITGGAAVADGTVFVGSHDGALYALSTAGSLKWKFESGGRIWSSAAIRDGAVYFGSEDHHLYSLDARTGQLKWKYETEGEVVGGAALADGVLYAGSHDDHLYAVEASSGDLLWRTELGSGIPTTPAVANGLVYVGSWDDHVYAVDTETGALVWNYWTGGYVVSSPTARDGVVYVGSDDGALYALDARTGELRWRSDTDGEVRSSPLLAAGVVYVGSHDGHLYAIDAATGQVMWKYETDAEVGAPPAIVGDIVLVGARDRSLYALRAGPPPGHISVTAASPPRPEFVPLEPGEIEDLLDSFLSGLPSVGASATMFGGGAVTTTRLSFIEEAVSVFETGYHLVTAGTPSRDGWVPRVFSREDYLKFVDENEGGDPELKEAAAFCCRRTSTGLELIIDGGTPSLTVVASLAHEAGHARQRVINPVQDKYRRDTNVGALREAQAIALEAALIRALGEYAGVNATQFPIRSTADDYIRGWIDHAVDNIDDVSMEHPRGRALLWMAALHDPELADIKVELAEQGVLSPGALLTMHDYLIGMAPVDVDSYVEGLLARFERDRIGIRETLFDRIGDVPLEGFVENSPDVFLVP